MWMEFKELSVLMLLVLMLPQWRDSHLITHLSSVPLALQIVSVLERRVWTDVAQSFWVL